MIIYFAAFFSPRCLSALVPLTTRFRNSPTWSLLTRNEMPLTRIFLIPVAGGLLINQPFAIVYSAFYLSVVQNPEFAFLCVHVQTRAVKKLF